MDKFKHISPITPKLIQEAEMFANRAGALEEQITDRIHYIMQSIFELFNKENAYWYFYGAGEGEVGDLWSHYSDDTINIVMDNCPGETPVILLKDGSEWGFDDSIPTRWLFENFEDELIEGKKKYKEKESNRLLLAKEKRINKKAEVKKLADAAKLKLSKKELQALKQSL